MLCALIAGLLAVFAVALPIWYGVGKGLIVPAFCKYICPAGTLEGAVGYLQHPANSTSFWQLGPLFTNKWVIMSVFTLLNASDAMPQTIVLNRQGLVIYNAQTPLDYEKLEALYKQALED